MSYDPNDHIGTNRRSQEGIRDFIHAEIQHAQVSEKTWLQKYGMFGSVLLTLLAFFVTFVTGYTTMDNQVGANTNGLKSKAEHSYMMLEFENRDDQLDNIREHMREDKNSNEVQFNKLDSKLDRNQQLMIDIYKAVSKPVRTP